MRDRIAVVFAVLVALAVAAGGVWFFLLRDTGPTRQEQAEAVVTAYASAWEDGDWASLSALAAGGADPRSAHEDAWARLEVAEATVRPGPVTVERGRADADLMLELTLAEFGEWSYDTHLTLIREEGEWRVDWSPSTLHPRLEDGLAFARQVTEVPERAPILDRDGTPLAERREAIVAGVHPARLDDPDDVVRAFTEHAGVPEERIRRLLEGDLNPEWFYPIVPLDPEAEQRVVDLLKPFPGIVFQRQDRRSAVTEELAAHVVGEVGEITAEQLEQLGPGHQQGDIVGRSGLERVFEEQLTGEAAGRLLLVRDAAVAPSPGPTNGPTAGETEGATEGASAPAAEIEEDDIDEDDIVQVLAEFGGEDPQPVRTTLDLEVQRALEQAVQGVEGALGAVVLHAPTGAIRAAVSHPLDEPFNRAFDGLYPPGSTFKIVTTAAVLAELGAEVSATCPAEVDVGGKAFTNAHDLELGEIDLATAFEVSCNTAFVQLAEQLQDGDLARYAQRFGFGTEPDLPLPVAGGAFPEPADITERAAAAIGQGRVQASPLHMASVAAAVASDGWRAAYLLQGETDDEEGAAPRAFAPGDAEQLRGFMRRVVEGGTGTAAQASGGPVHGKTGSAEFGQPAGEDGELPTHAWFVGFQGDLAFAFLVEGGGAGGDVAAPIAARFLDALS